MNMLPRITLRVFAFNQSALAEVAVRACLVQESEPMEIVMSDDVSTDDNWRDEHLFVLWQALRMYGDIAKRLRECDAQLRKLLAEWATRSRLAVHVAGTGAGPSCLFHL